LKWKAKASFAYESVNGVFGSVRPSTIRQIIFVPSMKANLVLFQWNRKFTLSQCSFCSLSNCLITLLDLFRGVPCQLEMLYAVYRRRHISHYKYKNKKYITYFFPVFIIHYFFKCNTKWMLPKKKNKPEKKKHNREQYIYNNNNILTKWLANKKKNNRTTNRQSN
jgi:hypothetical protein